MRVACCSCLLSLLAAAVLAVAAAGLVGVPVALAAAVAASHCCPRPCCSLFASFVHLLVTCHAKRVHLYVVFWCLRIGAFGAFCPLFFANS